MADPTVRLLHVLRLIPREPYSITTSELHKSLEARGINVSVRTLQRYMGKLMEVHELGIAQSPPTGSGIAGQGYWFRKGASTIGPNMDTVTALTLVMAGEFLGGLLPQETLDALAPFLNQAESKLDAAQTREHAAWKNKIRRVPRYMCFERPQIDPDVYSRVTKALFEDASLQITYKQREAPYMLHPLALVDRGLETILVAYVEEYKQVRQFMLHRMRDVQGLSRRVQPTGDFDIDEQIRRGYFSVPIDNSATRPIKLKLKLYRRQDTAEPWLDLAGTPLSKDQRLEVAKDGDSAWLSASVMDTWELRAWIMGLGTQAEVLGPRSLRDFCREQARQTLARLTAD